MAGMLAKPDLDKLFGGQFLVGDVQPGMPLWPLFAKSPPTADAPVDQAATTPASGVTEAAPASTKPVLIAYAFETIDFEPVRGYGGKPINVLVVAVL